MLVELARHLASPPAVAVITGPPAIGKTSLMIEAARRQAWRFPGGLAWANAPRAEELEAYGDPPPRTADLLNRLAGALGLEAVPQAQVEEAILAHTRLRPTLLLLDNLESLPPREMKRLERFLRGLGEESAAILTLRPPHPALEHLPAMRPFPLHEGLKEAEALRYLAWFLQTKGVRMEAAQMRAIVRATEGHPRLLELLAAQSTHRALQALLAEVEARRGDYTAQLEEVYAWVAERMEVAGEHRAWQKLQLFPADGVPEGVFWQAVGREGAEGLRRAALADFDPAAQLWRWHGSVADYARSRWPMEAEVRAAMEAALLPAWQAWLEALPPEGKAAARLEATLPHLEAALARASHSGSAQGWAFLEALHRALPAPGRTLALRAIQVPLYRARVALAPDEAERAAALHMLGYALSALGRREAALQATEEAVALYRQLAQANPQAFLPNLAGSLTGLGAVLSDLGRREAALQATEKAVAIRRKLAQANPQAFLPDLARSLNNLGMMLSALGRREAALAATEEAVALYRQLAQANPQAFLPDLAMSLNNLGRALSDLGRREAALQATEEAVALYRKLAGANPQAFLPDLAMSLHNLGAFLSALGRREAALQATEEAVALYRKLAQANPQAFLPYLAGSLHNLGNRLSALGRREAALAATEEAIALYRQLTQATPQAFLPYLAASLNNLGSDLSDLGRREAALEATKEAVAIRRQLAQASPQAFLPDLAGSLDTHGTVLLAAGQAEQAADAFAEGLRAILPFFQALPQAFGELTDALLQGYLQACQQAGREPDEALLQALR